MLGERRGNQSSTYVYEPNSFVPMARLDNLHWQESTDEQEDNETATPISEDYLPSYPYPDLPHLYQQWREPGTGRILDLPVGKNDPRRIAAQATASTDASEWGLAKVYHFHTDQIGTPRELTAHSGELAWQAEYKAWGNTVTCEWTQPQPQQIEQNLRFQGQYFDAETGLHYNRFRYYDADVGRFVSHDPIGLLGGLNVYEFAPNVFGWIDPWGLACHHIASNKHSDFSDLFRKLFKKNGIGKFKNGKWRKDVLNDPRNKVEVLGHKGPHSEDGFHEGILKRLQDADKIGVDAFKAELAKMKAECINPNSYMHKIITKTY